MRPKEVWEKPQNGGDGRRKRTFGDDKQRRNSQSGSAANNASDGSAMYSDASSPANDSGQTDGMEGEPQLPMMKHRRALSDHTISPRGKGRTLNEASAMAALQRAIRSSPHKFMGTEHVPIEVEDLTPQPTRRILFPSPSQSQGARSQRSSMASSGKKEMQQNTFDGHSTDASLQADKENCPPSEEEDHKELFEEDPFLNARSKTPTPTSTTRTTILKTPMKSPGRLLPVTGDFFSSAAKALLRPPSTPRRTPTKDTQPLGELTPFTAHLNQLLSETNNGSPARSLDFPSLPSLRSTPGRATRAIDFDFSQFDSQDLVSTNAPMPSSPPAWFGAYEDSLGHNDGALWTGHQLHSSTTKEE